MIDEETPLLKQQESTEIEYALMMNSVPFHEASTLIPDQAYPLPPMKFFESSPVNFLEYNEDSPLGSCFKNYFSQTFAEVNPVIEHSSNLPFNYMDAEFFKTNSPHLYI